MSHWLNCVILSLAAAGAAAAAERGPAPSAADTAPGIRQAESEARARHTRALRECSGAADYAACARDADAALTDTLRGLSGERQRGAVPPGPAPQDAQRVQGQRLMRELEQAAPRPRTPMRAPDPGDPAPRR